MSVPFRSRLARFFDPHPPSVRAPARLFWVALAIRVLYITLAHTYRIKPFEQHFSFGFEAGRIAAALVSGRGYADPFANIYVAHTGPTAWLPPLYPLLLAGVFKLCGVYTALSAWVILVVNSALSALIAPALWELGFRFAGRGNARWSAWLWVLHPAAMQYAVRWIWEMSLTTSLFTWALVLTFRLRATTATGGAHLRRQWAVFGLVWGLIALSNSAVTIALPACALWIVLGVPRPEGTPWLRGVSARPWLRTLSAAGLAAIVFLAVLTPWTVRNHRVFHALIPLRGNFGAELYLGNNPDATGFLTSYNHPHVSPQQTRLYARMGEVAYVRYRGSLAQAEIARDPALFVRNTLRRIYFFWCSIPHPSDPRWWNEPFRVLDYGFISLAGLLGAAAALRRRQPGAALFTWLLILLPLPYYIVTVDARFRHPLEPVLCVLGVYLFQCASPRKTLAPPAQPRYTS